MGTTQSTLRRRFRTKKKSGYDVFDEKEAQETQNKKEQKEQQEKVEPGLTEQMIDLATKLQQSKELQEKMSALYMASQEQQAQRNFKDTEDDCIDQFVFRSPFP
jgi:non-homologous end joining protein Ku